MKGKAACVLFFEETCPGCQRQWPSWLTTAQQYENQPIVFIAVNSGTTRTSVENYVRRNNISWPVIVDTDRSLEPLFKVPAISLRNIMHVRYVTPDGEIITGDPRRLGARISLALRGASWELDPASLPPDLRAAGRAIEFGNFPAATSAINDAMQSSDPELKQAALQLDNLIPQSSGPAAEPSAEPVTEAAAVPNPGTPNDVAANTNIVPPSPEKTPPFPFPQDASEKDVAVRTYTVGGTPIAIPLPKGMSEVGKADDMVLVVPPNNRLIASFAPTNDLPNHTSGLIRSYAMVQVTRVIENRQIGPSDFRQIIAATKKQLGTVGDFDMESIEEEFSRRLKSLDLNNATVNLNKPLQIGCFFSKQDAYGFGMLSAGSMGGADFKTAVGAGMVRVKNKLILAYLYEEYENEETVKALRNATEVWSDAILRANN
jgi:hypothetical protein